MMKKFRKMLCVFLCMAFAWAILAGCGAVPGADTDNESSPESTSDAGKETKSGEDGLFNEPGQLPIVKEPITLTAGICENGLVTDYNDNAFTNWLAEQTGIRLEFTTYPSNGPEARQKIDLAVTSNQELPGILFEMGFTNVVRDNYGSSGILLDTSDFLKKEAHYFNLELAKVDNGETLKEQIFLYGTSPDGKIYGYPGARESLTDMWDGRWYINTKWLDALNLEYPKTIDELYTVLKAFKEQDPNGNGQADEIPLMGSNNGYRQQPEKIILNSFLYAPYDNRLLNNGKVSMAYTQPEYREALRYINRLVEEELFSPISFTQDGTQLKAMLDPPADQDTRVGLFAGSPTGLFAADNEKKLEYSGDFDIIKGPEDVAYTPYTPQYPFAATTSITKYCENPEAAFRLLDFIWTEEASMRLRFGEKDVNWDYAEPGSKGLYESIGVPALFWQDNAVWGASNNTIWGINSPAFLPVRICEGTEASKILSDPLASLGMISKAVIHLVGHAPEEIMPMLVFTEEEQAEFTELNTVISTYTSESRTRFIVGDLGINDDQVWEDYLAELDTMGFKRYLEIMQIAYDRMYSEK